MNFIKKTLLLVLFVFSSQFLLAGNDYVTILARGTQPSSLIISYNGETYEEREWDSADLPRDERLFNYNFTIETVKSFEEKGFKVLNSNISIDGVGVINYFLLVRENE